MEGLHETDITNRQLSRSDDDSVFAYARGRTFFRSRDHAAWAQLSNAQLLSNRSGRCLAYKLGNTFYDPSSHEPLYYETLIKAKLGARRPST